jgi:hypothetical protein
MSQVKKDYSKHLPGISKHIELCHFSCNYQQNVAPSTLVQEKEQQKTAYNVLYMSGPLVDTKQCINDTNNRGINLVQGSMNPNANFFVPRVVYGQCAQQVAFE